MSYNEKIEDLWHPSILTEPSSWTTNYYILWSLCASYGNTYKVVIPKITSNKTKASAITLLHTPKIHASQKSSHHNHPWKDKHYQFTPEHYVERKKKRFLRSASLVMLRKKVKHCLLNPTNWQSQYTQHDGKARLTSPSLGSHGKYYFETAT